MAKNTPEKEAEWRRYLKEQSKDMPWGDDSSVYEEEKKEEIKVEKKKEGFGISIFDIIKEEENV